MRRLALTVLLALGLPALADPAAAQPDGAESLRYFQHWLVACSQETGCSASTYVFGERDGTAVDYQLRVVPSAAGAGYEISILANAALPDGASALVLRVDDEAPLRQEPGSGYRATGVGHALLISGGEAVRRLIGQMRAGANLRVGFTDRTGQARQVSFSLWGASAALDFAAARPQSGEARRASAATGAAAMATGDWSEVIDDVLPAMRRCLIATPGGPALVSKAWPMNKGMVGVRTLGPEGRRWDCVAEAAGRELANFDPVPAGEGELPGEGAPLFTPPGQSPPEDGCHRNERARDASGDFVGWLSYPGC